MSTNADSENQLLHEHILMLENNLDQQKNIGVVTVPQYDMLESDLSRPVGPHTLIFAPH